MNANVKIIRPALTEAEREQHMKRMEAAVRKFWNAKESRKGS